jgi:hypothetical protein
VAGDEWQEAESECSQNCLITQCKDGFTFLFAQCFFHRKIKTRFDTDLKKSQNFIVFTEEL